MDIIRLREVLQLLNARVISGDSMLDIEVTSGVGCDLISDSLCYSRPDCLLLTGLTNVQIIKVAEIIQARAIVFVRDKVPGEEIIEQCKKLNIPLLVTDLFLFESCGILYQAGLQAS